MSFSMDDLVSSFSGNHIGQEAIDLATLQAQLAQSLFCQPPTSSSGAQNAPRRNSYAQPCNTPTARTPSTSYFWDNTRRRSSSVASVGASRNVDDIRELDSEDMEEDEQMVEDLLSAPASAGPQRPLSQPISPSSPKYHSSPVTHPYTSPPTPHGVDPSTHQSLFTSTDPFYIAAEQGPHNHSPTTSFFAQTGRPAHNSPFFSKVSPQGQPIHALSMEVETRPVYVTAPGMFDR